MTMFRYLSITRLFWSTAFAAEMEYRANFVLASVTSLLHLAAIVGIDLDDVHLFSFVQRAKKGKRRGRSSAVRGAPYSQPSKASA